MVQISRHMDKSDIMEKSQYSFTKMPYLKIALILQMSQYKCMHMTETEKLGIHKYFEIFSFQKMKWKDLMFQKAAIKQETKDRNWVSLHNRERLAVELHANFLWEYDYLVKGCGKTTDGSESFRSGKNNQRLAEGLHDTEWLGD